MSRRPEPGGAEDVGRWLAGASALTVVVGSGPARALGLAVAFDGLVSSDFKASSLQAQSRVRLAAEAANRARLPPEILAVARLLGAHPQAGSIAVSPDGLLKRAGAHPVVELVGAIGRARCAACDFGPLEWMSEACPACDGPLRPDMVLDDEVLDPRRRLQAEFFVARADRMLIVGADPGGHLLQNILRTPLSAGTPLLAFGLGEGAFSWAPPGSLTHARCGLDDAVNTWLSASPSTPD